MTIHNPDFWQENRKHSFAFFHSLEGLQNPDQFYIPLLAKLSLASTLVIIKTLACLDAQMSGLDQFLQFFRLVINRSQRALDIGIGYIFIGQIKTAEIHALHKTHN